MGSKRSVITRDWYELVGDGAMITAGTMSLLTGIVLLITGVIMEGGIPLWLELGSGIVVLVGGLAGPVVTWVAHQKPVTLPAVGGALLSAPVTAALFFAFVLLSTALGWVLQGINDAEWFGPLVGVSLVAAGFVALVVWLVVDAVRDYGPSRRQHLRIDSVRLASAVVALAYTAIVVTFSMQPGGGEAVEALAFMLMGALSGACAVGLADLAQRILARKAAEDSVADE